MNVETITSRQNPLMTHLRKLASSRSYRKKSGEYLLSLIHISEPTRH